jgi:hypothetical protein
MSNRTIICLAVAGVVATAFVIAGLGMRKGRRPAPAIEDDVPAESAGAIRDAATRSQAGSPPAARPWPPRPPAFPDEPSLMARLHQLKETDPPLSLRLAREGNTRFPDSPEAPERTWIVVKSLVDLHRFDEARAEARSMVAKYPNDSYAADVQRHLLSNPP